MNNYNHILDQAEILSEIIWAIRFFDNCRSRAIEITSDQYFPLSYREKAKHKIQIYTMCIDRLKLRYNKTLQQLSL